MAPHVGFDVEHIREKARRDILNLLEGVRKANHSSSLHLQTSERSHRALTVTITTTITASRLPKLSCPNAERSLGPRKEEPHHRA